MPILFALALSLWVTGCESNRPFVDEPIIDRKGVDMPRYYVDKAECDAYANEVRTGEKVVRGVIGGAVIGGAIGAVLDREPDSAERGAGVGAISVAEVTKSSTDALLRSSKLEVYLTHYHS